MSDLIGRQLGPYQIIAELGHGGMANVYRATQPSIGREVAIKVLPAHFTQDRTFLERFNREVKVIAHLQHPRILPVHDYGEQDGLPYIVMAYMPGGTLADRIKSGALAFPEVARLTSQIAEGLDHAHEQGIIHRDFKPSNVLLDNKGNAYLADFGIAKVTHDTAQLTGSGMIGTPSYMAPEMARPGGITPLIDVYALGATVYQMVTGQQPYLADTPMGIMMAHATIPVPDARLVRADLPDEASDVIRKALAKEPQDRYRSAGDMAAELSMALAGAPLTAPASMDNDATAQMIDPTHGMTTPMMAFSSGPATSPTPVMPAAVQRPKIQESARQETVARPIPTTGRRFPLGLVIGGLAGLAVLAAVIVFGVLPLIQGMTAGTGGPGTQESGASTGERMYNFAYRLDYHTGPVSGLAYAPDGSVLAVSSLDKRISQWDVIHGTFIREITTDTPIESVMYSADGRILVTSEFQHSTRYEAATGAPAGNIGWTSANVLDAAISPDGVHAVSAGADNIIIYWTLDSPNEPISGPMSGPVKSVVWSPDGATFAAGDDTGKVVIFDAANASVISTLDVGQPVADLAYSPDSTELLTATQGNEIRILNVASGTEARRLNSVPDGMRAIDWSQDGRLIAGGGDSKTVIIWDAATGDPVQTIQQHEAPITAIAIAPDSSTIASGDESGKAIVWLLVAPDTGGGQSTGGVTATLRQTLGSSSHGEMRHVAYSNDGSMIVTGSESMVIVWDAANAVDRFLLDIGTPARAPDVALSPDGSVVVATIDDDIRAWSTSTGEELEDLKGHKGYPINVAFSPDGRYIVSSGEDHNVITWDTATREQVGSFDASESITAMAHAPDDSAIALGLANGDIVVVHTIGPDNPITLEGHSQQIEGLAYSPDSQMIASASSDGTVKLWHADGGEINVLSGDGSIMYAVAFSPDGALLAGTSEQGNLIFWSVATGEIVAQIKAAEGSIYDLAFSPDGLTLVLAPVDGIATMWDIRR